MNLRRLLAASAATTLMMVGFAEAANIQTTDKGVIVEPDAEGAHKVRVEVVTPEIFRVTAGAESSLERQKSLMIVDQGAVPSFEVVNGAEIVSLKTEKLSAQISLESGAVVFLDENGKQILAENAGRGFKPLSINGEEFHAIHQTFASDPEEGFYGLGQHQNGQMNLNGENVELAQHNISIAVPFVVSTGDYGILWDNNSITRFGDPRPFQPLGEALILRNAKGKKGGLTGEYYQDGKIVTTVTEADPDYQFLPPDQFATGKAVRDVFPEPFGTKSPEKVVWTGTLEAKSAGTHKFRLYGSHYVKAWIDGKEVVNRWRQNWNPWFFNFDVEMKPGEKHDIRVEWLPNDGYYRLQHLDPMDDKARHELSLSSDVADVIDYYFVHGENADEVISGYRKLTGKSVMLPRWAYGFWQSRQRYTNQEELVAALKGYRDRNIPIDNIVLDWFYWPEDKWGSHKLDEPRFPDPKGMVDAVHDMNAQIMISVWPKFYPGTKNFDELNDKGYIYQRNLEKNTLDWVGAGYKNTFYDPYTQEARDIYWRQMQENLDVLGFDAWWMDATEPDIHSNLSYEERALRMGPTAIGPGAEYFNSFALMNSQAIYEGERKGADPNERVFILTRSGFPGLQRYGSTAWSGDIVARWDDLKDQVAAGVNFSMSGIANWTFDIGGFAVEQRYSSEDPDHVEEWRELYLRWFQFGAFAPIFRSHGEYPYRESYNIAPEGSEVYDSLVWYHKLRYRMLPYIYTLAADTFYKDGTIMRGLVMDFEGDKAAWNINDQYMFGPDFLVSPVYEFKSRNRKLYLPAGTDWYDFYSGAALDGGQWIEADAPLSRMPLYVKAGAIVPMGPDVQYAAEKLDGPLTIYVYTGADGSFSLYEDDGETYDYEKGASARIPMSYDDAKGVLTIGKREGSFNGMAKKRVIHVRWVTSGKGGFALDAKPDATVTYRGKALTVKRK